MSRFRVYIKPFLSNGDYASDYTEVTSDVDITSIGSLQETIDQDEYEVGIFRFNQFRLVLNNQEGSYSDVGSPNTIFAYKRNDSLVKITWQIENDITQCGTAVCGSSKISDEQEIFIGLLNDESLALNADNQKVNFQVLGRESIFERIETAFSSINNGDQLYDVIGVILQQGQLFGIYDSIYINLGNNVTIDDKSSLENTTGKEALDELLFLGNSVLYIEGDTVYAVKREAAASSSKIFYGQGSPDGVEDIIKLKNFRNGLNKMYNFWQWTDTTNVSSDSTSIDLYGVKKNEISSDIITNTTKIDTILDGLRDEFKTPKNECEIEVPVTYDNLAIGILDRINVDYPTVFLAADDNPLPLYGVAIYGTARYPKGRWTLTIPVTDNWKILSRRIDTKRQVITFKIKII